MQQPLFSNAIYLGLQENIHIGSISNIRDINVNKQLSLFDTSLRKEIHHYFTLVDQVTCNGSIELTPELKRGFNAELFHAFQRIPSYRYLIDGIDSSHLQFRITIMADNALLPDSLASLLQRTKDSSLLAFRRLLVTPGNALLVRTIMALGFYTEFPLKNKLSLKEEETLAKGVSFDIGTGDNGCRIQLLPGRRIQVFVNKYYTVFGQFYTFYENG
jgi:hypothetical protein